MGTGKYIVAVSDDVLKGRKNVLKAPHQLLEAALLFLLHMKMLLEPVQPVLLCLCSLLG